MKTQDFFIGIGLLVISVLAIIGSYHFAETITWGASLTENVDAPYRASAGTFPRLVGFILAGLSLTLIVRGWMARKVLARDAAETETRVEIAINKTSVSFTLSLIGYFLLLQPLGFAIATVLFSICCTCVFDPGRLSRFRTGIMAVCFSCTVVILFYRILYLPLPRGMGIFRNLSELIIFMKL